MIQKEVIIMGFDEFGFINFVPFTKVEDFANYLKEGELMGMRCKKCGSVYFPPRSECIKCLGPESEMEWMKFSGKAKLLTYTVIHAAPTGFEEKVPYTIGVVDLEEGGRLLAWVEDPPEDPNKLNLGADVLVEPKIVEENKLIYVLKLA